MGKRLQSMDVTIHGTTKSFEFDPSIPVSSEDEGEASLEVLRDAETTEVVLVDGGIRSARVEVSYTYTVTGSVTVDLDDISVDDEDELRSEVESGEFYEVNEAITEDIERNVDDTYVSVDGTDVLNAYDEEGNDLDI